MAKRPGESSHENPLLARRGEGGFSSADPQHSYRAEQEAREALAPGVRVQDERGRLAAQDTLRGRGWSWAAVKAVTYMHSRPGLHPSKRQVVALHFIIYVQVQQHTRLQR